VVSHLAARHGIRVDLRAGRRGGVLALVRLPTEILVHDQAQLPYQPARPMLAAVAAVSGAAPSLQPAPRAGGRLVPGVVPGGPVPVSALANGVPAVAAPPLPLPIETVPADNGRSAGPIGPGGRHTEPSGGTDTGAGVSWFSRTGSPVPTGAGPAVVAAVPPAVPVTGGVGPTGLPLRVPMAQLPGVTGEGTPVPRAEADPDAVSTLLNRFYGGVRRAESENPNDLTSAPGRRGEREQR
jgi:hypothetical protein